MSERRAGSMLTCVQMPRKSRRIFSSRLKSSYRCSSGRMIRGIWCLKQSALRSLPSPRYWFSGSVAQYLNPENCFSRKTSFSSALQ